MNSVEIELVLNDYACNHFTVCKQMTDLPLLRLHRTWNHLTLCKQMINSKQKYSC